MLFSGAKAEFFYVVGDKYGHEKVGCLNGGSKTKTEDDWKVHLGLQAAYNISKKFDVDVNAVTLSLVNFEATPSKKIIFDESYLVFENKEYAQALSESQDETK